MLDHPSIPANVGLHRFGSTARSVVHRAICERCRVALAAGQSVGHALATAAPPTQIAALWRAVRGE